MSKISLIAKITAADGKSTDLRDALGRLVAAADEEDGLEVYSAHAANDEPGTFYFFELYRDGDALSTHGQSEAMKAAMAAVGECLGGAPELTMMTPVVAKGLDL
ncbi:MAG: antibiotic biosynthesis monooxygenase [Ilumatobacter sp.]|nr:antibiotic biosynthesis monooxygenase [Ilumatobacter sp.]